MARKLQVGIIGLGTIGSVHAEAIAGVGEAELAAVCDIDAGRLEEKGERYRVRRRYVDYRKMLADAPLDAVYVCTPNHLHRDMAVDSLQAGKHVFCEKPMALNGREASAMAQAARQTGKVLQIGMVWRQRPETRLVREYIREGVFGRIYHMGLVLRRRRGIPGMGGWFTTRAKAGGGALIDIGVHFLDLLLWLSDCWNPRQVSACAYAEFGPRMKDYHYVSMWAGPPDYSGVFDVDDYACGFVRFPDRITLSFEISWAANTREASYVELIGNAAGTRIGDGNPLTILSEQGKRLVDIAPQYDTNVRWFEDEEKSFVRAALGEEPPAATAEQGQVVMDLIDAIYRSSAEGREVEIGRV